MKKTGLLVIAFTALLFSISSCSTTASFIKEKNSVIEAKKRAYTNDSQINTSFTLTMGEREFILGEREEKKKAFNEASVHYRKAKDFYDEAFTSSYLFQRNWTLENYQRILQIKDIKLNINKLLKGAYKEALNLLIKNNLDSNDYKAVYQQIKATEEKIKPLLIESDKLLEKSIELSIKYDMFNTKYVSIDALKKLKDAQLAVEEEISSLFPENNFINSEI